MRRAFTLIELLLIVAIMAAMVSVGVVGLASSRGSTQVFGAARDVMAMIRRARSLALVTQKPVVITYSNEKVDDESCARVTIQAEKLFSSSKKVERVETISGEVVTEASEGDESGTGGETLEDVLSPDTLPTDVVKGLKLKVVDASDAVVLPENETYRSKISIFSTADNVSRTYNDNSKSAAAANGSSSSVSSTSSSANATEEDDTEEFKVAFAVNGMATPPHKIWIYRENQTPEKGLCIEVDRFGEPTCEKID